MNDDGSSRAGDGSKLSSFLNTKQVATDKLNFSHNQLEEHLCIWTIYDL